MKLQTIGNEPSFKAKLLNNAAFSEEEHKTLQEVLNGLGTEKDTVELNIGNVNKWNVGSNHGDIPHIGYKMKAITQINGKENTIDIGISRSIRNAAELLPEEKPFEVALKWAKSFIEPIIKAVK